MLLPKPFIRRKPPEMKILLLDNYDSFTYNLFQCVKKQTGIQTDVYRNDKISLEKVDEYDKIILSPGPGLPSESGILLPLIEKYASSKSILGVCLGHQAIAESFGGKLENLNHVFHGVATTIHLENYSKKPDDIFKGMDTKFQGGRYHSWVVSKESFPNDLEITATDDSGVIMGLQHKKYDVQGVQFHPESIMTPRGEMIIKNFLNL